MDSLEAFFIRTYCIDLLKRTEYYCEIVYDYFDIPYDYYVCDNKIHYRTLKRRENKDSDDFYWFKLVQIFDFLHKQIGFVFGISATWKRKESEDFLQNFDRASIEVKCGNQIVIIGNKRARLECQNYDHVQNLLFSNEDFFEMYYYEYVRQFEKIRVRVSDTSSEGYSSLMSLYILMKLKIAPCIHQNLRTRIITKNDHSLFKKVSKFSSLLQ